MLDMLLIKLKLDCMAKLRCFVYATEVERWQLVLEQRCPIYRWML